MTKVFTVASDEPHAPRAIQLIESESTWHLETTIHQAIHQRRRGVERRHVKLTAGRARRRPFAVNVAAECTAA